MATAEYHRNWYHAHRDVERKRRKIRTAKYRKFVTRVAEEIKLILGCKQCGYDKHPRALDFHHRDRSQKLFAVSSFKCVGLKRVLAEIEKCDVLCANCHRIHTHNERVSFGN